MSKPKSTKKAAKAGKTSKTTAPKKARRGAAAEELDRTPEELADLTGSVAGASGHSSVEGTEAPKEKPTKGDLMVFAFRLSKVESAQVHEAAGPGKASSFARNLLVKAAQAVRQGATVEAVLDAIAGC